MSDDYNKADERSQLDQLIADEFGVNADYVSELLRQFELNPAAVDQEWSAYFSELLGGNGATGAATITGAGVVEPANDSDGAGRATEPAQSREAQLCESRRRGRCDQKGWLAHAACSER